MHMLKTSKYIHNINNIYKESINANYHIDIFIIEGLLSFIMFY